MQVCQVSAVSEKNYEFFVVENFPSMSPRQIKRFFNFPFSNFKSMLTLGCHSNQRYYPTRIRNKQPEILSNQNKKHNLYRS